MSYKNKSKYKTYGNKYKNSNRLDIGLSGFLCTCNGKFREKDCLKEAYNILNEFADELYGTQIDHDKRLKLSNENDTMNMEADIDDQLAKEVKSIKEDCKIKDVKRFQVCESGANGIVFIKTTVPDPVKLAYTIVKNYAKGMQKSKFILRMLPVEVTCKAYLDEITNAVEPLLQKYFLGDAKTFAVVFNHRNNDNLKRDDVIEKVAELVSGKNALHKADLKQPQFVILIEVIRSICCLAVLPDYYALKKYNLLENALKNKEIEEIHQEVHVASENSSDCNK